MASALPTQPTNDGKQELSENQASKRANQNQVVPEDGYTWKKYGQKYIRAIGKNRSYFKCQRSNCRVKKKVEWSDTCPSNVRVVYEGSHTHSSSISSQQASSSSSSLVNQYNLVAQVFGPPSSPS